MSRNTSDAGRSSPVAVLVAIPIPRKVSAILVLPVFASKRFFANFVSAPDIDDASTPARSAANESA